MKVMSEVIKFKGETPYPRQRELYDRLESVLDEFSLSSVSEENAVSVPTVVGILEMLKVNLINGDY